jgi:hypothetical protein
MENVLSTLSLTHRLPCLEGKLEDGKAAKRWSLRYVPEGAEANRANRQRKVRAYDACGKASRQSLGYDS